MLPRSPGGIVNLSSEIHGERQTGLTGFTRSSLDRAAHYHNRLQRRRRGAPAAAAGPAGLLARRAPAAATSTRTRTSPDRAGPRTRGVCTGGCWRRARSGPAAARAPRRRRLPADPAVRAGLGAGGGRRPGAERPGRVGGRRPVPGRLRSRTGLPATPAGPAIAEWAHRPERDRASVEGVEGWKKGRSRRASCAEAALGFSPRGWRAPRSLYRGGAAAARTRTEPTLGAGGDRKPGDTLGSQQPLSRLSPGAESVGGMPHHHHPQGLDNAAAVGRWGGKDGGCQSARLQERKSCKS